MLSLRATEACGSEATLFDIGCHHCTGFLKGPLKLSVCIFLDRLRVLKLLDEFHFNLLHLHDLFFLLLSDALFNAHFVLVDPLDRHNPALAVVLDFHLGQPFLLVHDLILHLVLLLDFKIHVPLLLVVLSPDDFGLFCFLFLRQEDGFLDLPLLVDSLLVEHIVLLGHVSLAFVLQLVVVDFLHRVREKTIRSLTF